MTHAIMPCTPRFVLGGRVIATCRRCRQERLPAGPCCWRCFSRFLTELGMLELPESVAELASLRKVWLTHNALRGLPDSLTRLTRLEALLAPDNVFKELPQARTPEAVCGGARLTRAVYWGFQSAPQKPYTRVNVSRWSPACCLWSSCFST
jgi:hypothetical protein